MKTTAEVIRDSGIPPRVIRGVIRQLGGKESLQDICAHGIDGGFHGFIYYVDTVSFFKRHRADIAAMVRSMAQDLGEDAISMVASFRCLDDDAELRESIGRCLYGGRIGDDDTNVANALAWYAAEEVARAFCDY